MTNYFIIECKWFVLDNILVAYPKSYPVWSAFCYFEFKCCCLRSYAWLHECDLVLLAFFRKNRLGCVQPDLGRFKFRWECEDILSKDISDTLDWFGYDIKTFDEFFVNLSESSWSYYKYFFVWVINETDDWILGQLGFAIRFFIASLFKGCQELMKSRL